MSHALEHISGSRETVFPDGTILALLQSPAHKPLQSPAHKPLHLRGLPRLFLEVSNCLAESSKCP